MVCALARRITQIDPAVAVAIDGFDLSRMAAHLKQAKVVSTSARMGHGYNSLVQNLFYVHNQENPSGVITLSDLQIDMKAGAFSLEIEV